MAVRADAVVFALGAVLFGVGVFGIYTLPSADGGPLQVFTVTWREASTTRDLGGDNLLDGETFDHAFNLSESRATRLVFVLACHDRSPLAGSPNSASITAALAGPDDLTGSAQGLCDGAQEMAIEVQAVPTASTASGTSEAEARESLLGGRDVARGVGNWTLTLTLSRPAALPVGGAGSADWTLAVDVVSHEPQLTLQPR